MARQARQHWQRIKASPAAHTIADWWRRIEFIDGVLGVWDRIPRFVKRGAGLMVGYAMLQWGAALSARALEVGRDQAPWIVVGAVVATAVAWVMVEHVLFQRRPRPPMVVVDTGPHGVITVTEPVYVREDHEMVEQESEGQQNAAVVTERSGPWHIAHGDSVELNYGYHGTESVTLECVVADPNGHISRAMVSPELGFFYYKVSLQYPASFYGYTGEESKPPLEAGSYRVVWTETSWLDIGPPSLLQSAGALISGYQRYTRHQKQIGTITFTIE